MNSIVYGNYVPTKNYKLVTAHRNLGFGSDFGGTSPFCLVSSIANKPLLSNLRAFSNASLYVNPNPVAFPGLILTL